MPDISSDTVFGKLVQFFGALAPDPQSFRLMTVVADNGYTTIPSDNWLLDSILHEPVLSPQRYRRDIFDCDDYVMFVKTRISLYATNNSQYTRPLAVGFILTRQHAFNFAILGDGRLFLVNTQSQPVNSLIPANADQVRQFLAITDTNPLKFIYL